MRIKKDSIHSFHKYWSKLAICQRCFQAPIINNEQNRPKSRKFLSPENELRLFQLSTINT